MEDQEVATVHRENVATPPSLPISEMQIRIAFERPRDVVKCRDSALKELIAFHEFADEGHYSIPYKDNKAKRVTFVEGLSIKAAMALVSHWGNSTNGARVADDRGDHVMVQGMFFDIEKNNLTLRELTVSKYNKGKNAYRLSDDALHRAIAAGESKAVRNAILASLPVALKNTYMKTIKKLVLNPPQKEGVKAKTYKERIEDAKSYFVKAYGVKADEVAGLINKTIENEPGVTEENLLWYLVGVKNALREGAVSVDFVFRDSRPPQMPREKAATAPVEEQPEEAPGETLPEDMAPSNIGDAQEPV